MTLPSQAQAENADFKNRINQVTEKEKVLCPHCRRTATNGIKCKGICVADNDY